MVHTAITRIITPPINLPSKYIVLMYLDFAAKAARNASCVRYWTNMTPKPEDLREITAATLNDYNSTAEAFWRGTRDHDVSQNINALLRNIAAEKPFTILDFGCGPGRDLKRFTELGHVAVGLDGAEQFATMARTFSGCEVWQQNFLELNLPDNYFDGIFANATMFHIPSKELPRVLKQLHASLKPGGILFSSNPRSFDDRGMQEGWNRGRYGTFHGIESWRNYLTTAGFSEIEHYYRPDGLPLEQQPWLASVWRK